MSRFWLFILFLLFPFRIQSQESRISEVIITIAEDLAASETDAEASNAYIDRLYELSENPVNLNSAREDEIARLFFLSDFQVKALTDYTHSTGKLISFNELAYIPGFDKTTAEMIIPFATLSASETIITDSVRLRNYFMTNLSLKTGKHDTSYLGSAFKILTKYKFTAGNFSGGITFEKDQGEKFFSTGTISPDFFSANIAYNGTGAVRRVILGDYSARFGQGTNINTGISTGLSLSSQGYMSAANEIKPYTSSDENNFLRGMATMISINKIEVSLFYSNKSIDATLGSGTGCSKDYIESLYKSGNHNTTTLVEKKGAASETLFGLNLTRNFRDLKIGISLSANRFSLPVKPDYSDPEKIFSFSGRGSSVCSFYYNRMIKNILLYGELSANDINKYALVQGLSFRPADRMTINLLYWKYSPGYTGFHGTGPGGSSGSYPEQSLLGNFTFEAARHLFLSGGYIIRHYPWLKYRCSSPSIGIKREIGLKYLPLKNLEINAFYSYTLSMVNNSSDTGIPSLKEPITRSSKIVFKYSIQENLTLGTRIDLRIVKPSGSKGVLLFEDLSYRLRVMPLTFWLRYCIFSTDDYDSRIYTWENDMLYSFSIPAMYGPGSRFYIMAGWKLSDKAEFRFKYGISSHSDTPDVMGDVGEFRMQLKIVI
jgi:hypothetical protein